MDEKGFMTDQQGRLVPTDLVKDIDKLRDQTVRAVVANALEMREAVGAFKRRTLEDILTFVGTSAEQYGVSRGGQKGNLSLTTFDGRYRIMVAMADQMFFDERLHVAKDLINACINRWSAGSRSEIRILVQDAFQTDKTGKINTARVLGLRRLAIDDPDWKKAMQAISDSIQVSGSKRYLRIYERGENGEYVHVPLDMAAL
ncbi:MAG: DUF3164 family protein [Treponema sp.]|nr:DUF3164 family protein [Treponema sp.]